MARSRSGMPRSIQVGVPAGWFRVTWLMGPKLDPGTDRNRWPTAIPSGRALRLTPPPACRPPARPTRGRVGAAGRSRPALPAVRPAVRRHRALGRGDLGAVRAVVGDRDRGRGAVGGAG